MMLLPILDPEGSQRRATRRLKRRVYRSKVNVSRLNEICVYRHMQLLIILDTIYYGVFKFYIRVPITVGILTGMTN